MTSRSTLLTCLLLAGCEGTGQPSVRYEGRVVPAPATTISAGAWVVELSEASLGFGPVVFCAAQSGSATLCDAAIAEIPRVTRIDALDARPQSLGTVDGFAGSIQSASYDFGIHWFATEPAPTADPQAPGGHSLTIAGTARRGADTVRFVGAIDVVAQFQGQRAVPSSAADARIEGDDVRLEVHLDVGAWIAEVDFDGALDAGADPFVIAPGTRDHDAIVIAMVSQAPPLFVWRGEDVAAAE